MQTETFTMEGGNKIAIMAKALLLTPQETNLVDIGKT